MRYTPSISPECGDFSYISAKLPELNLVDTTRISNGTNSPRLALLYRQNFWKSEGQQQIEISGTSFISSDEVRAR